MAPHTAGQDNLHPTPLPVWYVCLCGRSPPLVTRVIAYLHVAIIAQLRRDKRLHNNSTTRLVCDTTSPLLSLPSPFQEVSTEWQRQCSCTGRHTHPEVAMVPPQQHLKEVVLHCISNWCTSPILFPLFQIGSNDLVAVYRSTYIQPCTITSHTRHYYTHTH